MRKGAGGPLTIFQLTGKMVKLHGKIRVTKENLEKGKGV